MGDIRLLELVQSYFIELGYEQAVVEKYFSVEKISEMVAIRLANANVVNKNKKDKSSHQSHIAITGETIFFFYNADEFERLKSDEIEKRTIGISIHNVSDLAGQSVIIDRKDKIEFLDGIVTIGKRTQNQVQLSKYSNGNCSEFNSLRDNLWENDLFIMLKERETERLVVLGIKESFYQKQFQEYVSVYNANTYLKFLFEQDRVEETANEETCTEAMRMEVYTEKSTDENGICYFCGCTLQEYMRHLPVSYRENDIQRGIVKNVYLDRLINTIINKDNIPIITLVGEDIEIVQDGKEIELSKYRILDGLQRTYRIQQIWNCMNFFIGIENKEELLSLNKIKLARSMSKELQENGCDINIFSEVLNEYKINGDIDRFWKYFEECIQWFEVWENLSLEQETQKMLILNAGHKQMDIRHQLELLFLNVLPKLNEFCKERGGQGIIRNKDKSDMQYSKERVKGEYYFSHIISAIISFNEKKPVTTNADLVNQLQQDTNSYSEYIEYKSLQDFMEFLLLLDNELERKYGVCGYKWIARETVLVGVFSALGIFQEDKERNSGFRLLLDKIDCLNLDKFEDAKQKNVEISKVNVGNVTKNAVKSAVLDLLNSKVEFIEWKEYFGRKEDAGN